LREEYNRLGLTWAETHPKIIQQELEEYELTDGVAVPSLFVKNSFLTQNFSEKKLFHNVFGANTECFVPGHKQDNIFRIIYAGSLTVRKGIHYLLEAFKQANLPNSELCLVGGVSNSAKSLLGEFNEKIKFIGHVPQDSLVNYYQNSSVFVMASIEEGMAMVQLQALSCGLPLICTTNTGGEDLLRLSGDPKQLKNGIQEYPAGYLVPVRDSQAIAECLQFLGEDPILLRSKQESALVLRNSDLSWINYSERVVQSYEILMNNRSNQEKNAKSC
jgi:glycosyltransferase involved in cell wall biosynthesis